MLGGVGARIGEYLAPLPNEKGTNVDRHAMVVKKAYVSDMSR